MYYSITLLATATAAQVFQFSDVISAASSIRRSVADTTGSLLKRDGCPSVWSDVSKTLTDEFLSDGSCTDNARAAIRAAFHDCFNGACDGSLILADECSNSENSGLAGYCSYLSGVGDQYKDQNVGMADLIQFAGAHAIKTCPLGPTISVKVGRKDSSSANPTGILPPGNAKGDDLYRLFQSKGFSATDLAALIGAHSTAKQFNADPSQAGAPLDTTPGKWDVLYYAQTIAGTAPFTLQADKNLANHPVVGVPFKAFAASQGGWAAAFVPAMEKMSMMGVSGHLVDCTSALPGGSIKRDIRAAPIADRFHW
ncbi:heme peroxidase [Lindgomyces ingoldianus]|uniref:Heme peroxidase n=1 Tax=Lindgomyces ingoldianus TaxID=673940 RepID=A0ACB6QW13_9PLEO|nr:heme peroxidase [Lindgomyces ingoldianus]KAF2471194.1 heme peroxidase [Lindgomyces ingoldianus]